LSVIELQQNEDPKCFVACLEWVEPDYPVVAALGEEVITSGGCGSLPPLRGHRWIKDRTQLIGCAFIVVLVMFAAVVFWGFVFARK